MSEDDTFGAENGPLGGGIGGNDDTFDDVENG
jgi:hypothetical protein